MAGRSQYEDDDSVLWDSPVKTDAAGKYSNAAGSAPTSQEDREASLEQELQNVRQVNEAIEGVIQSLRKAKDNMQV